MSYGNYGKNLPVKNLPVCVCIFTYKESLIFAIICSLHPVRVDMKWRCAVPLIAAFFRGRAQSRLNSLSPGMRWARIPAKTRTPIPAAVIRWHRRNSSAARRIRYVWSVGIRHLATTLMPLLVNRVKHSSGGMLWNQM